MRRAHGDARLTVVFNRKSAKVESANSTTSCHIIT